MSNETFIVSKLSDPETRVVIRIFKSKASDFETEARIFRHMGSAGMGPREIELTDIYRVEECINGRPLTFFELSSPLVQQKMM